MSEELKDIGAFQAFTNGEETVISFKGSNYYRACDAFVRNRPEGGASYCIRQTGHEGNNHVDFSGHYTGEQTYIGDDAPAPVTMEDRMAELHQGYSEDIEVKQNPNGEVVVTLNVSCRSRGEIDEAMDVLLSPLLTLAKREGGYVSLSLYDSRDN